MRKIAIQTCAGKVEIETLYGQNPETRQWRYPLKEQLGVAGRLPLSPLLAQRLCFTATQSLSFAACAATATVWGAPVNDSMVHRCVQKYGARIEERLEQETERILDPATRNEALAELEDPAEPGADESLVVMLDGWMIRERGRSGELRQRTSRRSAWPGAR